MTDKYMKKYAMSDTHNIINHQKNVSKISMRYHHIEEKEFKKLIISVIIKHMVELILSHITVE